MTDDANHENVFAISVTRMRSLLRSVDSKLTNRPDLVHTNTHGVSSGS